MKGNFVLTSSAYEELTLEIDAVGARGDGVARAPDGGGPVFVPYALAGERVRVRVCDGRAELVDVLEASPERRAPDCAHFGVCGGCALQHMSVDAYRAWKRGLVVEALERAGLDAPVGDLVDAGGAGRRRATFHAVRAKAVGLAVGFARRGSHAVFDLEACPVAAPALCAAVPGLRRLAEVLLKRSGRLDLAVTAAAEGLDVDARGGGRDREHLMRAADTAAAEGWARLTLNGETALERAAPTVDMDGAAVRLPPGAFLQATAAGEVALAARVIEAASGARTELDLYSGVGTFALRLARAAAVTAVEGDAAAVAALSEAAKHASGLKPVTATRRDLARNPMAAREIAGFDVVVLDPPRAGAAAQTREIAKSPVTRVVMVSCAPATFARDAATLVNGGYRLEGVAVIDQFSWSRHVEMVGLFRR